MAQDLFARHNAISFAHHVASSDVFKNLFRDGMALVEETADYLDGSGREDARGLSRTAALNYASESMRLTTRLMQIASWLLLQRAVNEGEMTQAEAMTDKKRTAIAWQEASSDDVTASTLPVALRTLIEASLRLQERLIHLDTLISDVEPMTSTPIPNPLDDQMSRLRAAFCQ